MADTSYLRQYFIKLIVRYHQYKKSWYIQSNINGVSNHLAFQRVITCFQQKSKSDGNFYKRFLQPANLPFQNSQQIRMMQRTVITSDES